jgi:DNA gyrase subunit A
VVLAGSLRSNLVLFSNFGAAYVTRFNDVPASTGYGEPVQKLFKFDDRERIVGGLSLDPRLPQPERMVAVSAKGYGLRFALAAHSEVSTRAGRRYARTAEGDELIGVQPAPPRSWLAVVTSRTNALVCKVDEVNELSGPGRGVTVIKVGQGDRVAAFLCTPDKKASLRLETNKGRRLELSPARCEVTSRGGKGREMSKKDGVKSVHHELVWVRLPEEKK